MGPCRMKNKSKGNICAICNERNASNIEEVGECKKNHQKNGLVNVGGVCGVGA